jgi:hypothetical protein
VSVSTATTPLALGGPTMVSVPVAPTRRSISTAAAALTLTVVAPAAVAPLVTPSTLGAYSPPEVILPISRPGRSVSRSPVLPQSREMELMILPPG